MTIARLEHSRITAVTHTQHLLYRISSFFLYISILFFVSFNCDVSYVVWCVVYDDRHSIIATSLQRKKEPTWSAETALWFSALHPSLWQIRKRRRDTWVTPLKSNETRRRDPQTQWLWRTTETKVHFCCCCCCCFVFCCCCFQFYFQQFGTEDKVYFDTFVLI